MTADATLTQFTRQFPDIQWTEPVEMRVADDPTVHYACRVCIGARGIKGHEIPDLPTEREPVLEHLRTQHGARV